MPSTTQGRLSVCHVCNGKHEFSEIYWLSHMKSWWSPEDATWCKICWEEECFTVYEQQVTAAAEASHEMAFNDYDEFIETVEQGICVCCSSSENDLLGDGYCWKCAGAGGPHTCVCCKHDCQTVTTAGYCDHCDVKAPF